MRTITTARKRNLSACMLWVGAVLVLTGCTRSTFAEDVTPLCTATGEAMTAVDEALVTTTDGHQQWTSAIEAVEVVVKAARDSGYRGAVDLATDWQASVVAASQADDRGAAFSLLIESQGNEGLLFMCDTAGAPVPGVEPVASDDLEAGLPGWAGPPAWIAIGLAAVAAVAIRRWRPEARLVRSALLGLLTGSLVVLAALVAVGAWLFADLNMFGLALSPADAALVVLSDPATPIWALLLGGTTGAAISAAVHVIRQGRDRSPVKA